MYSKAKPALDAFTLSLGGMTAITSFIAAPAVASDRINQVRDARMKEAQEGRDRKPRLSLNSHWQSTQCHCA